MLRAAVVFAAIANPPGAALAFVGVEAAPRITSTGIALAAAAVASAAIAVAVLAREALSDALELSQPSVELAVAVVMATAATRTLWHGRTLNPEALVGTLGRRAILVPLALPLLAGPAALAAAVAYGERYGDASTIAGAAIAIAATAAAATAAPQLARRLPLAALAALVRLTAALLLVLAFGLAVDGVRGV